MAKYCKSGCGCREGDGDGNHPGAVCVWEEEESINPDGLVIHSDWMDRWYDYYRRCVKIVQYNETPLEREAIIDFFRREIDGARQEGRQEILGLLEKLKSEIRDAVPDDKPDAQEALGKIIAMYSGGKNTPQPNLN